MTSSLPTSKKWVFNIILVLLITVILEGGTRVGFRVMGTSRSEVSSKYQELSTKRLLYNRLARYTAHPYLSYIRRPGYDEYTDDWGIQVYRSSKNQPSRDTFNILTVGGSTTESIYPFFLHRYLEQHLKEESIAVINAGVSAWTTTETLINFELRGLQYQPDLVVIYQAFNDIFPSCSEDFQADYSHWRTPIVTIKPYLFDYLPRFLDYSSTYVALRWIFTFQADQRIYYGLSGVTTISYPDFANCPFNGRDTFRRNIISFIGVAKAHNVNVLLVTQAHILLNPEDLTERRKFEEAEAHNDITRQVAQDYEVGLLDFAAQIEPRKSALMRRDMVHFDDDGYRILAEMIGEKIITDYFDQ